MKSDGSLYTEDIKKKIIKHLEKHITEDKLDVRNLTFESLFSALNVPKDILDKALKSLIDQEEIVKTQSNAEFYIPTYLVKHENVRSLKFGNPFIKIAGLYLSGLILFAFLLYKNPAFSNWVIINFAFTSITLIIGNSIVLGLIAPLTFGTALDYIYRKYFYLVANRVNIKSHFRITIVVLSAIAFIVIYVLLSVILNDKLSSTGILTAIGVGVALATLALVKEDKAVALVRGAKK